jgi:hypothetical protein
LPPNCHPRMPPLTQKSTLHGQLIAIPDAVIIPLGKIANGYHVCFTQRHESMRVAVWPFSSPLWQKWSSAAIARARSVSVSRATRSHTRVEQRQLRHHSLLRRAGDPTWARVGLDRTAIKRPNQQTRVRAVFIGASSSDTARFRQHLWSTAAISWKHPILRDQFDHTERRSQCVRRAVHLIVLSRIRRKPLESSQIAYLCDA